MSIFEIIGGMEDDEYLFTLYELIVPLSKRYN